MNYPKHRLHLVNKTARAPGQLLYSSLSRRKSQEIKLKKKKQPIASVTATEEGTASAGKQKAMFPC